MSNLDKKVSDLTSTRSDSHGDHPLCRRYMIYLAVIFLALAVYIPFRYLAALTNTSFHASSQDFLRPYAVVVWPVYVTLLTLTVSFTGSFLSIRWPLRVLVVLGIVGWIGYSELLDSVLGLTTNIGRAGLDVTMGSVDQYNTTYLSQTLCVAGFVLGVVAGEVTAFIIKRREKS